MKIPTNINPEELNFHAQRYSSAYKLQELLENTIPNSEGVCSLEYMDILRIAGECIKDGADWGTIPCLGGEPEKEWRRVLGIAIKYMRVLAEAYYVKDLGE